MPPKSSLKSRLTPSKSSPPNTPPPPFKPAPSALAPFTARLPPGPVYLAHVDPRPAPFKRNLFLVPCALNLAVVALFIWRVWYILPYYLLLLESLLGTENETTLRAAELEYADLVKVVVRRAATFALDFGLGVFVWPWPYEFVFGGRSGRGSPLGWRRVVGFRQREVYVRRSREGWDRVLGGKGGKEAVDLFDAQSGEAREARETVLGKVRAGTAPQLMQAKTGYLMQDGDWDLDWQAMVDATWLVDKKEVAIEAFGNVMLLHHERFGWVTAELGHGPQAEQETRRMQVLAFREALGAIGKEDLFFRWVEMIQSETTQPGGFTEERQIAAAQKIRDMFKSNGVDFDELWQETVGTEGLAGMPS